jgi:PilZ domain
MPEQSRRRFPRVSAEHVVLARKSGADEVEEFGKMQSLGLGGCMFVSAEPFGEGSVVDLMVSIGSRVVPLKARVAYELAEGDRWEVGVEFLQVQPADAEFLRGFLPESPAEAS